MYEISRRYSSSDPGRRLHVQILRPATPTASAASDDESTPPLSMSRFPASSSRSRRRGKMFARRETKYRLWSKSRSPADQAEVPLANSGRDHQGVSKG